MQPPETNTEIFTRLAHAAVVAERGGFARSLEKLVQFAILQEPGESIGSLGGSKNATVEQIIATIKSCYELSFARDEVEGALDRLIDRGHLLRISRPSWQLKLAPQVQLQLKEALNKKQLLEERVCDGWLKEVTSRYDPSPSQDLRPLWKALKVYLASVFRRHGAECLEIFAAPSETPPLITETLRNILQYATSNLAPQLQGIAEKEFPSFFLSTNKDRVAFQGDLLDATFSFFALVGVGRSLFDLEKGNVKLVLFLDTNTLFGILDLREKLLVEISKVLLETVQREGFPVRFYYTAETAKEFERCFKAAEKNLRGRHWSRALSEVSMDTQGVSGIELKYHKTNLDNLTDADAFLDKFKNYKDLLKSKRIELYNQNFSGVKTSQTLQEDTLRYNSFLFAYFPDKHKSQVVVEHDMFHKSVVELLRPPVCNNFLDAGNFFLTCDFTLIRYDREERRKAACPVPFCILPNHFLQLLRLFVQRTDDFDRAFLGSFSEPFFRALEAYEPGVASKVLSTLALYKDVPKETAIKILTNNLLMSQLQEAITKEKENEFTRLIENEFVIEARQQKEMVTLLRRDTTEKEKQWSEELSMLKGQLSEKDATIQQLATKMEQFGREAEGFKRELDLQKQKAEKEACRRKERRATLIRFILASAAFVLVSLAHLFILSATPYGKEHYLQRLIFGELLIGLSVAALVKPFRAHPGFLWAGILVMLLIALLQTFR